MKEGKFRTDLFYRLNVIHIQVPPLRRRKEDIPPLADHFMRKYGSREGKKIQGMTREALSVLMNYPFPGNVRELENAIERAVVFADGDILGAADLPVFLQERTEDDLLSAADSLVDRVRVLETREIRRALRESGGVKSKAARTLGITERMLSYKVKTYGLAPGPKDPEKTGRS